MIENQLKVHINNGMEEFIIEIPASETISFINKSFVENGVSAIASINNGEMVVHTDYNIDGMEPVITVIDSAIESISKQYVN